MAIGTSAKSITGATWTNVGPGPVYLQRTFGEMRCAIQTSQPGANDPGFSIDAERDEFTITVAENVWVRNINSSKPGRLIAVSLA